MAATGVKPKKNLTLEEILALSNGGYSIFAHELGKFPISKAFHHPLRKDRAPSAAIFVKEGVWFLKDFSETLPTMTAIQFVQNKYSLDYKDAIDKICQDLGINQSTKEYKPSVIIEKPPVFEESEIHIGFSERKWIKKHYEFWDNTSVTKEHCERYNTFAVKDAAINRRRIKIGKEEVVFAYFEPILDKVKLYFPEREGELRHRGNVPNSHIWNINNIGECENLIVQKSMKDLLVTTVLTPCVVAVQNESAKRFMNANNAEQLQKLSKNIYLAFGSDEHGKKHSNILSKEYGFGWVNPPNKYLEEGINDAFSLSSKYGIEAWNKCLKNKKILI
jgi:hypothetical protein